MYENYEELKQDVAKHHKIVLPCVITNFDICIDKIIDAIKQRDINKAINEMSVMTSLYDYATDIKYTKQMKSVCHTSIEAISMDFTIAKLQIEDFFCKNFITGKFEITEEILNKPFEMVDWDAYWNKNSANFIIGCKKANKLLKYEKDNKMSAYYEEDKAEYHFKDIFYSSYNGGRIKASFEKEEDALIWSEYGDVEKESDGLWWAEQPAY